MILINLFILFLCLSIDLISAQTLPSQCFAYTTDNDASRHVNAVGNNGCDTMFMSGSTWIRFTGASGTQLPTSPISSNRCGTQVTGWYAGAMPAVSETITNGRACFSFDGDTCKWSNTIGVTNCGSFYVYQLTMPPVCSARYCTETPYIPTTILPPTTISTRPSQCINYEMIDDPTRNTQQMTGSNSDQTLFSSGSRWIRFIGAGGTQIPTSSVPIYRCGTSAPGWYSGGMPSVLDTTVNGTVCYTWSSNSCAYSNNIQVTNCGSYYVYNLPPPSISGLRYCTETPIVETTTSSPMFSSQCYDYTTINDPTRNINQAGGIKNDLQTFSSSQQWVRFEGAGGTQIPTTVVPSNRCDTYAPGWYSSEMPSVEGTTVNGTVCYTWTSGNCAYSNQIQVTNCGSYYVYRLGPPPVSGLRYCTDTPIVETTTSIMMSSSQCYSYETIDDPTRNINQGTGSDADLSYFSSGPRWVRFVGSGGTQIPTSAVPRYRCGTNAAGWYSSEMPSVEGTTINGTVCYTWSLSNCDYSNQIQVTNCGSYYVYYLSAPTGGGLRYCTDTPTVETTTSIMMSSSQCYNYETIDDPTRNINEGRGSEADQSYFSSGPRWVRFVGSGGTEIPTSKVAIYRCGTSASGWYSGAMPTASDTTTSGTACFTWSSGDCAYKNDIQVTNCGSYYVYYLSAPTTGGMRYCTTNATDASVASRLTTVLTSISSYIQSLFEKLFN